VRRRVGNGTYIERRGSDIAGANAAAANLGISCERCSQALTWAWSDRQGSWSLPLSQARIEQNWWVKESHWRISVASKHTCVCRKAFLAQAGDDLTSRKLTLGKRRLRHKGFKVPASTIKERAMTCRSPDRYDIGLRLEASRTWKNMYQV
jgi:hypothetical protein